jgi:hypothetical protein
MKTYFLRKLMYDSQLEPSVPETLYKKAILTPRPPAVHTQLLFATDSLNWELEGSRCLSPVEIMASGLVVVVSQMMARTLRHFCRNFLVAV